MDPNPLIERTMAATLRASAGSFSGVVLTGPRQSGKTTLVRHLFGATHRYCTLDDPTVREEGRRDPNLLLARFPPPVILDEIQYAPDILHAIKVDMDAHRKQRGRYILTGSQVFPLMQGVTESLAGRVEVLSLASMSLREVGGQPDSSTPWREMLLPLETAFKPPALELVLDRILRGGYPECALNRELPFQRWHAAYVSTYLERDVRTLRAIGDLGDFQRFLSALAARAARLLNLEELGRDLGITAKTAKAWLSVLEASGQILILRPYFANLGKRLVKRPKVYFLDTGTQAYLLGVSSPDQLLSGIAAGTLFESAVAAQIYRLLVHRGQPLRLHFWRTAAGHEVDFLLEDGTKLIPIEAKLTATPTQRDAAGIEELQRLLGRRASHGLVVCLCRERFPLTKTVDAVPLGSF
jgi:hypothetical protein